MNTRYCNLRVYSKTILGCPLDFIVRSNITVLNTVEPMNNGHNVYKRFVHYSEIVPYSEVLLYNVL